MAASKKKREKKRLFITTRYFNIEKVWKSSWDTVDGRINSFTFRMCIKKIYKLSCRCQYDGKINEIRQYSTVLQ